MYSVMVLQWLRIEKFEWTKMTSIASILFCSRMSFCEIWIWSMNIVSAKNQFQFWNCTHSYGLCIPTLKPVPHYKYHKHIWNHDVNRYVASIHRAWRIFSDNRDKTRVLHYYERSTFYEFWDFVLLQSLFHIPHINDLKM